MVVTGGRRLSVYRGILDREEEVYMVLEGILLSCSVCLGGSDGVRLYESVSRLMESVSEGIESSRRVTV